MGIGRGQVLGERSFRAADGDRIEMRVGDRAVPVSSCRLFHVGGIILSRHDRLDMGERSMSGFLFGPTLAERPKRNCRIRMAVYDFDLAVRQKKRAAGDPEWLEWRCRVSRRQPGSWSFVVLAEIVRVGLVENNNKKI